MPVICVHIIPSKIENIATLSGEIMLLIPRINELSFDTTVNTVEPDV